MNLRDQGFNLQDRDARYRLNLSYCQARNSVSLKTRVNEETVNHLEAAQLWTILVMTQELPTIPLLQLNGLPI